MLKLLSRIFLLSLLPILCLGQPEQLKNGFEQIDSLNRRGIFERALDIAFSLQNSNEINPVDEFKIYLWQYILQRNRLKKNDAHDAILKALELDVVMKAEIEFRLYLAESYAAVKDSSNYYRIIPELWAEISSETSLDNNNIGKYYLGEYFMHNKGSDPHSGIEILQKALANINSNETYYKGQILRGLGNMSRSIGDFDKALDFYERELSVYSLVYPEDHFDIAATHYNMGAIYYEKMEYQLALDNFLATQLVWSNAFEPQNPYMRYLNEAIGDMYWELGDKEQALTFFEKAMNEEQIVDNDRSKQIIIKGDSLLNSGNYNQAKGFYENAVKWRKENFGENHILTGACQNFVARAVGSEGDIEGALEAYQVAIDILVDNMEDSNWWENPNVDMNIQSHNYLLESLTGKAGLLIEWYKLKQDQEILEVAFDTQQIALGVLEQMTTTQMSESSRLFWSDRTRALVEQGVETAYELFSRTSDSAFLEEAFFMTEKSKSLFLLAAIQEQNINSFANVPSDVLEREYQLKKEIISLRGKIATEENRCADVRAKMLELWREKLNERLNDFDIFRAELKTKYPEYYELRHDLKVYNAEDFQAFLRGKNAVAISFFFGPGNAFVFKLDGTNIKLRKLGTAQTLSSQVLQYLSSLRDRDLALGDPSKFYNSYKADAFYLFTALIQPELRETNESTSLILIPDAELSYLPFESLITSNISSGEHDYRSLPYLMKKYRISYSPSASIKIMSEDSGSLQKDYFGLAPEYEGMSYAEVDFQPYQLNFNQDEIKRASELFKGKFHIGDEATEDILVSGSKSAGIIHLAMHGQVEDEHPLLSKLFLNPSNENDGILHTYEIYNLELTSQLVILSACNTAQGKLVKGEGIQSLERAFQYAGSPAMISTFWTVDDASSSLLMQSFLKNIKSGEAKDEALQNAKLHYLQNARPEARSPYYWSSFKLTGNTRPLSNSSSWFSWWALGSISLIGVLLVIFRRRRTLPH